jgi:hypothetical protein
MPRLFANREPAMTILASKEMPPVAFTGIAAYARRVDLDREREGDPLLAATPAVRPSG